jgi:hypothetical protein
MLNQLVRNVSPEEEELLRKREELASIREMLAERELELADVSGRLASFEAHYLREVGVLYAELDDWNARIAEFRAEKEPSADANQQANDARKQARQTYETAHGEAAGAKHFDPSPDLRRLFREVAKCIHPDLAKDSADQERRTRLMAEANLAYRAQDADALQRILADEDASDDLGEGIGAELIRIIRQISQAKKRVSEIEGELERLLKSEIALLKTDAEKAKQSDRDLMAELAAGVREKIRFAKANYNCLVSQGKHT